MYRVIEFFADLQDGGYAYHVGDKYPRDGVVVSEPRLRELAGSDNKRGMPLIKEIPEKKAREEAGNRKKNQKKNEEV